MRFFKGLIATLLMILGAAVAETAPAADASPAEAVVLANIAYQNADYALAARYFLQAARATGDAELAENAARSAARSEDIGLLREAGGFWSELQPDNIAAAEFLARVYADVGDLDAAVVQLDRIRRSYATGDDEGFDSLVPYLQRESNRLVAVELMKRLVLGHEKTPAAFYGLAYMQARAGQLEDALQAIEQALALKRDFYAAVRFKADVLVALKRAHAALAFLKQTLQRYDEHSLRVHYAHILRNQGDIDEAIRQYRIAVIDRRSQDEEDYIALGDLLQEQGRYAEAADIYQRLIAVDPELPQAWYHLGELAELTGDEVAAIDWYRKVPESQFYVEAGKRRALLLARRGDIAAARAQIADLRELHFIGTGAELSLLEGELLQNNGQLDEARQVYEAGLADAPHDAELLLARALLAKRQRDFAFFEAELKKLIRDDPQHVAGLQALGVALCQQRRYRDAEQYLAQLALLKPEDETVAGYYGEALWQTGHIHEAKEVWARALQKNPQSSELREFVGRYSVK